MGKLKFFGLVGVIFVALVFIGFNFPQAKGKPPREEVNWGVKIPVDLENMLYGTIPNEDYLPHTYINNDNDIKVSVKRLGYTSKGAGKGIYYQFNFVLYNADIPVGFQDVYFTLHLGNILIQTFHAVFFLFLAITLIPFILLAVWSAF